MLYSLIKIPARLGFYFYVRHFVVNNPAALNYGGPMILASNHPNSFLDAIIYATVFKKPVYSLARGDVFTNPLAGKILRSLNMLPVYRVSEGVENLESNYDTFEACKEIFKKNGIVLIFSEGGCINEWHLRPLKKGTARLAISSWDEGIPVKILPAALNYNSFRVFGKNVWMNFGKIISVEDVATEGDGKRLVHFNKLLTEKLQPLVVEVDSADRKSIRENFFVPQSLSKKILLFLPAVAGFIIHAPLYLPARYYTKKIGGAALDHYDSILVGLLFFTYPFYLCLFY